MDAQRACGRPYPFWRTRIRLSSLIANFILLEQVCEHRDASQPPLRERDLQPAAALGLGLESKEDSHRMYYGR